MRSLIVLFAVLLSGAASSSARTIAYNGKSDKWLYAKDTLMVSIASSDSVVVLQEASFRKYRKALDTFPVLVGEYEKLVQVQANQIKLCNDFASSLHKDYQDLAKASKSYSDTVKWGVDTVRRYQDSLMKDIAKAKDEIRAAQKDIKVANWWARWSSEIGAGVGLVLGLTTGLLITLH